MYRGDLLQTGADVFGFLIAKEIPENSTLILDPVPVRSWATYYGGSGGEYMHDLQIGPDGNIYFSGSTSSSGNIATINAHQDTLVGIRMGCW